MSSAFPQIASAFGPVAQPIDIPERGTHVPSFYVRHPHENPEEIIVKKDGVPVLGANKKPFTVAEVAIERRWAIGPDGEVMDMPRFTDALLAVREEWYRMRDKTFQGDLRLEAVPDPDYYVSWRVDPDNERRLTPIGYDKNATRGAKPDRFYDSAGEALNESRIETLCASYHDPKLRRAMTTAEIREVEAHLNIDGSKGADGIAAKLELLTELHDKGELSDEIYLQKVSALSGKGGNGEAPLGFDQTAMAREATCGYCGHLFKSKAGRMAHERHCKKRKALDGDEGG